MEWLYIFGLAENAATLKPQSQLAYRESGEGKSFQQKKMRTGHVVICFIWRKQ